MSLTASDVDRALSERDLRGMRIVHFVLSGAVLAFALVVLVLAVQGGDPVQTAEPSVMLILSGTHALLALTLIGLSFVLPALVVKPSSLERMAAQRATRRLPALEAAAMFVSAARASFVLRLALQEGPAMFGLVICLLGVLSGEIVEQPLYWLNALTTMLFLISAVMNVPSRERVLNMLAAHGSARI